MSGIRTLTLSNHVGFDSLPDQLVNKTVMQGFCFNMLCVGELLLVNNTMQSINYLRHLFADYNKAYIICRFDQPAISIFVSTSTHIITTFILPTYAMSPY